MLTWLENHLIVLGLLAILVGLGLGALLARAQRKAGRIHRLAAPVGRVIGGEWQQHPRRGQRAPEVPGA